MRLFNLADKVVEDPDPDRFAPERRSISDCNMVEAAASDAHALDVILLAGALLAFVGAVGLMMFGRPRATPPRPGFAVAQ